jgi:GDPmannose 4,6-dehydratase
MKQCVAVITGATGQDGSYLCELLLDKGYDVKCLVRRSSCRSSKYRIYQASTSEMFGKVQEAPQRETTPFYPRSVYGVSKLAAHWLVKNYRESYGLFACSGILFNHESPRRGVDFVTKKITEGLKSGKVLELGNLDAVRDWGHAKDYVEAMWRMLQQDVADEYVVATGKTHSVRDFVTMCLKHLGKEVTWEGQGEREIGKVGGEVVVRVSPKFYRPCEVDALVGDASKIKKIGWEQKHSIEDLITDMLM